MASALALALALTGCNQIFGLDDVSLAPTGPGNAYTCSCTCKNGQIAIERDVCLPANLNPVLDPSLPDGFLPTAQQVIDDCQMRVQENVERMEEQCVSDRLRCDCTASADLLFADECNVGCSSEDLADDCSNLETATNVPGEDPVCLVSSFSASAALVPTPLAAGLFGPTSQCEVDGEVVLARDGDTQARDAEGVVRFSGEPCPGATCSVGMAYRLSHVDDFEFDFFLGLDSVVIENVIAGGATVPEGVALDASGAGSVATDQSRSSGRGRRSNRLAGIETSSDRKAYTGTNGAPVDVAVEWTTHVCAVSGTVLGSLEDADASVSVALAGTLVNRPPAAGRRRRGCDRVRVHLAGGRQHHPRRLGQQRPRQ